MISDLAPRTRFLRIESEREHVLGNIIENRVTATRKSLPCPGIDTLLVLIEENRRYLSGFTGEDSGFDESAGALLISDSRLILATDSRFELQAQQEAPLYDVVCYKEKLSKSLPDLLKALNTRKLGFESNRLSFSQYKFFTEALKDRHMNVELVATENIVEDLRIAKSETEIEKTRNALVIAENAFRRFVQDITPAMTEISAAWAMEKGMRDTGADALSFPTICASGPNSALPHAIPGDRPFQTGEPILFDWGVRLKGYCSDISRTVIIGKPDETFEKVFQTVNDAQRMAIDGIKAGANSKAVDSIARNHIDKKGFRDKFGHGLGHGTGLAIHEQPRLSPLKETTLEAGMIVTVEPGIYLPGWGGIRLENMVVVRENGAEILNTLDDQNFSHIIDV